VQQLKCRFYSRAEIAALLSVNLNDSNHFAERVQRTLDRWGYEYEYTRRGVTIVHAPETPLERLREILIRELKLNVQVDPLAFACFLYAFSFIPDFDAMPWTERAEQLEMAFDVNVSHRTLQSWCNKLAAKGIIARSSEQHYWQTRIIDGNKCRFPIDDDDPFLAEYLEAKMRIYNEKYALLCAQHPERKASSLAWKETMAQLWEEFECCFYSCKLWEFNAIKEDYLIEVEAIVGTPLCRKL